MHGAAAIGAMSNGTGTGMDMYGQQHQLQQQQAPLSVRGMSGAADLSGLSLQQHDSMGAGMDNSSSSSSMGAGMSSGMGGMGMGMGMNGMGGMGSMGSMGGMGGMSMEDDYAGQHATMTMMNSGGGGQAGTVNDWFADSGDSTMGGMGLGMGSMDGMGGMGGMDSMDSMDMGTLHLTRSSVQCRQQ